MNDNEIVSGIINKDELALKELSKTYGKLIYGVINKILFNNSEINYIEECFNDVLISLWRSLDCYDSEKGSLRNFLISVSKYKAIDYKREINKRGINLEFKEEIAEVNLEENLDVDNEDFYILLKNLKEEDKNIFIKKYLFEESIEKIAKDLGVSRDLVYKRLSRGREKIKNEIIKNER